MESYKSILKSTSVIAFVQFFKIIFVFIQNKIIALLIGTTGYGIYGLYYTFSALVSAFSTFGIDQAGVREVARKNNSDDFGKTIWSLKFLLFFLSILSCVIIFFLREKISISLFGNNSYSNGVAIVGLAILFNGLSQGYISILNGLQKIKYIAISQILGIVSSAIFAIIFIYFYKNSGIPYFILIGSFVIFIFSAIYVRKLNLPSELPNKFFFLEESKTLFSVGAGLAYSAIIVSVSTYFTQVFIRKHFGIDWVGMFNASNIVSNVYLGIILTAMGVDLMPKLAKVIHDDSETSNLVNSQMELGLLLSTTGVICVIAFSAQFITIIYSSKFILASQIMKWHIMASVLKLVSYPLGYILIVRKKTLKYILVQTVLWGGSYLLLTQLSKFIGVKALGLDFFIAFIFYIIVMYLFTYKSFKASKLCIKIFIITWSLIIITELINIFLIKEIILNYALNAIVLIVAVIWTNHYLKKYFKINIINLALSKIK